MPKLLLRFTIITVWFATSIVTLLFTINLQSTNLRGRGVESLIKGALTASFAPYNLYSATPSVINDVVISFSKGDARPLLLDKFFSRYHSPLAGHGEKIVNAADKNGIDWRLIPGIAFQESNLCSKIPKKSYNCWGWAIYTGKLSGAAFQSYDDAIEKIYLGLKREYYDK